jgi:hypothetical protein
VTVQADAGSEARPLDPPPKRIVDRHSVPGSPQMTVHSCMASSNTCYSRITGIVLQYQSGQRRTTNTMLESAARPGATGLMFSSSSSLFTISTRHHRVPEVEGQIWRAAQNFVARSASSVAQLHASNPRLTSFDGGAYGMVLSASRCRLKALDTERGAPRRRLNSHQTITSRDAIITANTPIITKRVIQ